MPGNPALSHKNTLKFRLWLFFTVVPAVFFSDFAAKLIVRRTMTPYGETIPIVDGFIKLRFIYNEGIAFGLNPGFLSKWVLMIVSLVVVALLIGYIFLSRYDDR
ncbi:MAG: signal peptidase II, partial [Gemmatimonadota bacterium]|nr:signal peptidase II [Gemmatimonadota bacterium]